MWMEKEICFRKVNYNGWKWGMKTQICFILSWLQRKERVWLLNFNPLVVFLYWLSMLLKPQWLISFPPSTKLPDARALPLNFQWDVVSLRGMSILIAHFFMNKFEKLFVVLVKIRRPGRMDLLLNSLLIFEIPSKKIFPDCLRNFMTMAMWTLV